MPSQDQIQPFSQCSLMKVISGLAIDYGLDLETDPNSINMTLGKVYASNDDIGESFLSLHSQAKIKQMFPP
jgi:hypothetical protein